ncbi:MAG: glycoside hydrolase family 9 protein [Prolixibacteraceae bacterium]|jgi:peptidoglycan/xylan/chitin deacetylase (PgdA/CDA1 family)|nr:glycoside hydrolase family 9 protein [Prolixibacteraceae bacterium]
MKITLSSIIVILLHVLPGVAANSWLRINQLGYLPQSVKVAVLISEEELKSGTFQLCDAITEKVVFAGKTQLYDASAWGMKTAFRLDFSSFSDEGGYFLRFGNTKSHCFRINDDVYEGMADFLLNYMRQQRCGFNPYLNDSCHRHDGIIVDHPQKNGQKIDVTGGWHDASDYLQYLTTSANAVYQMLFAYLKNPDVFGDRYDASGRKGANGIPDILDEARWGLEWMVKMNPAPGEMYNQIADDRDHRGYRLPNKDSVQYDLEGIYRPVYFIAGKPQGLAKHKNRTTGVSSSAAKYASSFALGAQLIRKYDAGFAARIEQKAVDAYRFALSDLGACQTACNVSPYFYEEDNFVDDLQLAACELHRLTGDELYLQEARKWGLVEPVTPWMAAGFARHYQFYPFVNLGHSYLSATEPAFAAYLKDGLQHIYNRAEKDPFLNGIPFIWCSNNLVAAALTQARCYRDATGDPSFAKMEAALRDWLFGCNPWGTSMICGLPAGGDNPQQPHSAITYLLKETTTGGLVDGPVYKSIYDNLRGIHLMNEDVYAPFQLGKAVYHDDMGDYSSNEPTMDGTASLSFYLSSLEKDGKKQTQELNDSQGAVVQINPSSKDIYLVFTADDKAEGGTHILDVLAKNSIKASFFFTGNFLRNRQFRSFVKSTIDGGHYVGPHSDGHLLYCDWKKRDSLLVDRSQFETDLRRNYSELQKYGISAGQSRWFMPPYEWYNRSIVDWSEAMGAKVINFTPGTSSNADYTTPEMKNYRSSDEIMQTIFQYEAENTLNGCILLVHPGTDDARTDKFYRRLQELIDRLKEKNYTFKRL